MTDYKALYFELAGTLASAIEQLDKLTELLKEKQCLAEQKVIENEES